MLLMKGTERDPVARSKAISTIVKSVSVIPDPITRATYLQECSALLGMKEEVLVTTMNRFIHKDLEDQQKRSVSSGDTAAAGNPSASGASSTYTVGSPLNPIEPLLLQLVLRHGEALEICGIRDVEGNVFDLTIAQYVQASLEADGLSLSNPIYVKILNEAAEHSGEEGFVCSQYFNLYPDADVQRVVGPLLNVNSFFNEGEGQSHRSLRDQTEHLLAEYKLFEFEAQITALKRQISSSNDIETLKRIMSELKELQLVRNELAKQAGRTVNRKNRLS